jgi:hypothetical protein
MGMTRLGWRAAKCGPHTHWRSVQRKDAEQLLNTCEMRGNASESSVWRVVENYPGVQQLMLND